MGKWQTRLQKALLLAVVTMMLCPLPAFAEGSASQVLYQQGVNLYRNGQYDAALKPFQQFVQTVPQSSEGQYYLAITLAQLGRYADAKQAYQSVIKLEPNGEAAELAQQGLAALPNPNQLDRPPLINAVPQATASTPTANNSNPYGAMDPNTMQMMMMMNSMGGSGGNSFNPMMFTMMQNMTNQNNGQPGQNTIPPEAMSTMMMNQMMNNMDFGGSKKDDE